MTVPTAPTAPTGGDGAPPPDPWDVRLARSATGLLRPFNLAGVLAAADVHVAAALGRLGGEADERVLLAAALTVRAVRLGSVCLDLPAVRGTTVVDDGDPESLAQLPWPEPADWLAACTASPLVAARAAAPAGRPLRLVDEWLYLERYWRQETLVRTEVDDRGRRPAPPLDRVRLHRALDRLFPHPDAQRLAAAASALRRLTVVAGGPGTGKTTTVARLLAVVADQPGRPPRVALAAPTGKAAARLREAVRAEALRLEPDDRQRVGDPPASTLHRLLGPRPDARSRFRHDRHHPLPYDVVVVDETSMVSLTLLARLLDAVPPTARLVLVGDPDQLTSVEAGAVLGDVAARPMPCPQVSAAVLAEAAGTSGDADDAGDPVATAAATGVVRLDRTWRYGRAIGELAAAVRDGNPQAVLGVLQAGADEVAFVDTPDPAHDAGLRADVVAAADAVTTAARRADAAEALRLLGRHRVLCAHRSGPYGVSAWTGRIERWLAAAVAGFAADGIWYRGRPLLVTRNDYEARLFNGDSGVVVDAAERGVLAAFERGEEPLLLHPSRLAAVQTAHALTVHRSQGSQFDRVSVLLPPPDSPLLTRELLYTAVTRATSFVRVLGTAEAVRIAVSRPAVRASGLRRLGPG